MKRRILGIIAGAFVLLLANGLVAGEDLVKWSGDAETLKGEWSGEIEYREIDGKVCGVVDNKTDILSKKEIPVEYGKKYVLSGTFKSFGKTPSRVYYGFACYDKDKKQVASMHSNIIPESDTKLAEDCKEGDKKIIIKANKKWTKNCVIAFRTKDDFSDLPNREVACKVIKVIPQEENMELELSVPVKKAYPAGTKVRAHTTRYGTYIYTTICGLRAPHTWKTYKGIATIAEPGKMSHNHLRPGTAFVRIIILPNYRKEADEKMAFTDLTLKAVE